MDKELEDLQAIIDFEEEVKAAYKPVDELFDTILDDDGFEDFFVTAD